MTSSYFNLCKQFLVINFSNYICKQILCACGTCKENWTYLQKTNYKYILKIYMNLYQKASFRDFA